MTSHKLMILFCIFYINLYGIVLSEVVFNPPIDQDVCMQLCSSKALNIGDNSGSECERGCRLFNIAMNTNWSVDKTLDLNSTKDQCFQACSDAYSKKKRGVCFTGCTEMFQLQKEAWSYYLEQQVDNSILEVEVSLVADPAFREQNLGKDIVYKIPQTLLKTMPLRPEMTEVIDSKDWNPCPPQSNEIPRWIVGVIAVGLTIFTLYVSFILPSRTDTSLIEDGDNESSRRPLTQDKCTCVGYDPSKELTILYYGKNNFKKTNINDVPPNLNLVTLNEFLSENYHLITAPPPKYTIIPVNDDHTVKG